MRRIYPVLLLVAIIAVIFIAYPRPSNEPTVPPTANTTNASANIAEAGAPGQQQADVEYTLLTGGDYGGLVFVGRGGQIDGEVNPTLTAEPGQVVQITLVNADAITHNLTIDEFGIKTADLTDVEDQATVIFKADEAGEYVYYCALPGHRAAGMWGILKVGEGFSQPATAPSIVRSPDDVPEPIGDRGPETIVVNLEAQEVTGQLADGVTYDYYTFGGKVPAPMIRVRVGDTVELHLKNSTNSSMAHSIDLHAVNGPGGGAVYTQTAPGEESVFTFTTLAPGLFVYHCATPSVATHIANGMYGLILVEPEGGLPDVDREFYVMQGEVYTAQDYGALGHVDYSYERMLNEDPEYFVFNGAAAALTIEDNALRAEVGDTVRIFFGVGGPNFTSSFHVIGEIFDRLYLYGSLTSPPMTGVQTTTVPPGDAAMVEFKVDVPGRDILVDHALARLERGLVGFLFADGDENPDIYHDGPATP
jgi:nitrite reductase (NO-forming)